MSDHDTEQFGTPRDLAEEIAYLRERDRHAHSLLQLTRRLERANSEEECFLAAQQAVCSVMQTSSAWVFCFSDDRAVADMHIGSGPALDPSAARLTIQGDALLEEIASKDDIVVVEDARIDPRTDKVMVEHLGCRTLINVPIVFYGRHLGALGTGTFHDEGVRVPTSAERDYMKAAASHLAVSLDRLHSAQEWQRAEGDLRERELRYRTLVSAMAEGAVFQDAAGRVTAVNPAAERMLGISESQLLGQALLIPGTLLTTDGASLPEGRAPWQVAREFACPQNDVVVGVAVAAGDIRWLSVNCQPWLEASPEGACAVITTFHDVTEKRRTELRLRHLNRSLATLSAGNVTLVRAADEEALLRQMCQVLVEIGEHSMAWIGLCDDKAALRPVAWAAECGNMPPPPAFLVDLAGRALCERQAWLVNDIVADDSLGKMREVLLQMGFRAFLVLPLSDSGVTLGAISILARAPGVFDDAEKILLGELAGDLAFGIQVQRARQTQEKITHSLQQAMVSTVQAIAGMLELRDSYTAGHERRVAELAVDIGRRLGMAESRLEGLYMAGIIHDVGKICIPSEILSKPARLNAFEYALIQTHVEAAYGILHPIAFPWPIADIVRQHHERLDGTGYPRGLAGGAILPESRILAIADVVEAMTNHRPYRAGLGVDKAIEEIREGRGRIYDQEAVDACIAVLTG